MATIHSNRETDHVQAFVPGSQWDSGRRSYSDQREVLAPAATIADLNDLVQGRGRVLTGYQSSPDGTVIWMAA